MKKKSKNENRKSQGRSRLSSVRAQGHVEIIISFVLFIGAIVLIFWLINPFAITKEKDYQIDDIQKTIIKETSKTVGELSVILARYENGEVTYGNCYNFIEDNYINENYIEVQDEPSEQRKYTIYFSDVFTETIITRKENGCSPDEYTLGSYLEENTVVWEDIKNLAESYNADYNSLRVSLGITKDFSFGFREIGSSEIPELSVSREMPLGIDLEVKEFPLRIMKYPGEGNPLEFKEIIFNLKVW